MAALEKGGKSEQLCLAVASKVAEQIPNLTAEASFSLIKGRDGQLKLALTQVSASELGIDEPSEKEIALALKES